MLPLFLIDVIGVLSPIMLFVDRIGGSFEWPWLLQPFALALAHLAVEPIERLLVARISHDPSPRRGV